MNVQEILLRYGFFNQLAPSIKDEMLDKGKVVTLAFHSQYYLLPMKTSRAN
jgi:hypothetical protein